jgi:four helix bundle protein
MVCIRTKRIDAGPKRKSSQLAYPEQGERPMSLHSYKDLDVWKLGVELAACVDELSEKLVSSRRFAMSNQLCSAALSVPSNIAEGNGRVHRLEYAHHVSMARGSLLEVESILYVAIRCKRLSEEECAKALRLITAR